jgi:hypothetical protein
MGSCRPGELFLAALLASPKAAATAGPGVSLRGLGELPVILKRPIRRGHRDAPT